MPAEMWRVWGHVALATVIGIAGLILLAQRREALPEADLLGVALFAVCVAYALWQVRRYFDARERREEGREAVER